MLYSKSDTHVEKETAMQIKLWVTNTNLPAEIPSPLQWSNILYYSKHTQEFTRVAPSYFSAVSSGAKCSKINMFGLRGWLLRGERLIKVRFHAYLSLSFIWYNHSIMRFIMCFLLLRCIFSNVTLRQQVFAGPVTTFLLISSECNNSWHLWSGCRTVKIYIELKESFCILPM